MVSINSMMVNPAWFFLFMGAYLATRPGIVCGYPVNGCSGPMNGSVGKRFVTVITAARAGTRARELTWTGAPAPG
jgi:hypothetical protein